MRRVRKQSTCPHCPPEVETWEPDPSFNDPRCICNKPMMIYIPAGEHIHCPVHPDYRIFGQDIRCGTSGEYGTTPFESKSSGLVYEHDSSKDLTFDSTRPFGTATGADIGTTKFRC